MQRETNEISGFMGFLPPHILRALRGRQPLCGTGVLSVMETTSSPPMVNPLMADYTQGSKINVGQVSYEIQFTTTHSLYKRHAWLQWRNDSMSPNTLECYTLVKDADLDKNKMHVIFVLGVHNISELYSEDITGIFFNLCGCLMLTWSLIKRNSSTINFNLLKM